MTGAGATVQDYFTAVYDRFPYVIALIALITFVLLARTFRSLLLPIKAVILNLLSMAAVFGAIVFFWQEGHGSEAIFDVSATGAITFWLPVIIFAFLFGLSMDYEVFILARMREEYDATGSTAAGRHHRPRPDRPAGHVGRADPVLRVRCAGVGARDRHQGAGHRARRRHPDRRHHRAGAPRPGAGQPVRPLELVAAGWMATVLRVEPSPLAPKGSDQPPTAKPDEDKVLVGD